MSKKRRQAVEDEETETGEDRDWLVEGILFVLGLWIIYSSNWNGLLIGIGSVFSLSPVLQIPAIRVYINSKTGQQIFQVRQSHISNSNVVGSAREVHFHEAPKTIVQPPAVVVPATQRQTEEPDWDVDDEFTLTEDEDWRDFDSISETVKNWRARWRQTVTSLVMSVGWPVSGHLGKKRPSIPTGRGKASQKPKSRSLPLVDENTSS